MNYKFNQIMGKNIYLIVISIILSMTASYSFAFRSNQYKCGIAEGFPPYQFKNEAEKAAGFDVESIKLIFQEAKKHVHFCQMNWGDIVGNLAFTNELDCAGGMEICDVRKRYFDFTAPYYNRKTAVFIRADNFRVDKLEDLVGKQIAGDKHSLIEALLEKKGIKSSIRIRQTERKEESMQLLKNGDVTAVIVPKAVGFYLAKQLDFKIRSLEEAEISSPVAIAVKKGNSQLLTILDTAVQKLVDEGKIDKLYQNCFSYP